MDILGDFSSYIEAIQRAGESLYTTNVGIPDATTISASDLNAIMRYSTIGDCVSPSYRYSGEPLRAYEISEGVVWHSLGYPTSDGEYLVTLEDCDVAHIKEFKNGKWLSSVKVIAWANLPAVYRGR